MKKIYLILLLGVVISGTIYYFQYSKKFYQANLEREAQLWSKREENFNKFNQAQKKLAEDIKQYAGNGECEDSSQCKVIGLGEKVCNETSHYFYYSTVTVDESKFNLAVALFNQNQEKYYKDSFITKNCGHPPKSPVCRDNFCQPE